MVTRGPATAPSVVIVPAELEDTQDSAEAAVTDEAEEAPALTSSVVIVFADDHAGLEDLADASLADEAEDPAKPPKRLSRPWPRAVGGNNSAELEGRRGRSASRRCWT